MKSQYKFNPENINYSKLDNGLRVRFWRVIAYLFAALFIAFILNVIFALLFDSPKEKLVRTENQELQRQYEILGQRKATVDTVFKEISHTDENIFRLIFESEPAGYNVGEYSRLSYSDLKALDDASVVLSTAKILDSLLEKIDNEKLDYNILRIKSEDKAEMLPFIPAIQPIENNDLSRTASGFGYRMHPIYKIMRLHEGMDYAAPAGTPVFATGAGKVIEVTRSRRGQGNMVTIDHGYGFKTVYAHLSMINMRLGRTVKRGDVIGEVGNTGMSFGPHLHYEVLMDDEAVNPVNFFFLELGPKQYNKMITLSKNSGQSFD